MGLRLLLLLVGSLTFATSTEHRFITQDDTRERDDGKQTAGTTTGGVIVLSEDSMLSPTLTPATTTAVPTKSPAVFTVEEETKDDDDYSRIQIVFSLWFPGHNSLDQMLTVLQDTTVEQKVLEIMQSIICDAAVIVTASATTVRNECGDPAKNPSILLQTPTVQVLTRQVDGLTWSLWFLNYRLISVGDVYIEEALMNTPNLNISELVEAAKKTFEEVLQLRVDVELMEGRVDDALEIGVGSPTGHEWENFRNHPLDVFIPRSLYPLRIAGFIIFGLTNLIYFILRFLASCRRRAVEKFVVAPREDILSDNVPIQDIKVNAMEAQTSLSAVEGSNISGVSRWTVPYDTSVLKFLGLNARKPYNDGRRYEL